MEAHAHVHQNKTSSTTPAKSSAKRQRPKDWLPGLKQNWIEDGLSGFIVFLIALPLSVGIAMASGAPPSAGLLAAIIGGIFGSLLGGSYLTINGPAAGLIVVVYSAIQGLSEGGDLYVGFRRMLAAAVVAGVLQVVMALFRLGSLGVGVPGSVIHGMLSAIGVIIMAKQFHVVFGVAPHAKTVLGWIAEIPQSFLVMNTEVTLIAAVSFLIILGHRTFDSKWARYVPAPLLVVLVGAGFAQLFDFEHTHLVSSHLMNFQIGPQLLLNIPENLSSAIIFPDFSQVFTTNSMRYAISLALVASIEALLTVAAVDRLDPYRRVSNLDRDLLSKGICNSLCGLFGALPIIAEIVRSKANISNGAKTRWANFLHGFLMLAFLGLAPTLLHHIPLSALAAILISVGFTLAHPSQLVHAYKVGIDHFLAFVVTLWVTLASDLLVGVFAGIAVELFFNIIRGGSLAGLFRLNVREVIKDDSLTLWVESPLVFTNFLKLRKRLETSDHKTVVVNLSSATIVDQTVVEQLTRLQQDQEGRNIELEFSDQVPVSKHPLAARKRPRR